MIWCLRAVLSTPWWKMLLSWNIISTLCLILVVFYSQVKATNFDQTGESSTTELAASTGVSDMEVQTDKSDSSASDNSSEETLQIQAADCSVNLSKVCSNPDQECSQLNAYCIECEFNESCLYGTNQTAKCMPKKDVNCSGGQEFNRVYMCSYCYQLPTYKDQCNHSTTCALNKPSNYYPARPEFISTCWTRPETLCLGRRCFHKKIPCNWSKGYKWSTAMLYSIFLGGFGADRFYLGLWKEAIGKLLSFGGLGVWTLVDVILIGVGYIGPFDGSIYL